MVHNRFDRWFILLFISIMAFITVQPCSAASISSFTHGLRNIITGKWAYAMLDTYCAKNFGVQEADGWCVDKAHEFLAYLQVPNAYQINIRKLEFPSQSMNLKLDKLPSITLWTGLWFNPNLENSDEALWCIAHEAAHFALNHPLKNLYTLKARPILIAGVATGLMIEGMSLLLKNSQLCSSLVKSSLAGLVCAPIIVQIYVRLIVSGFNAEKDYECDADLTAAQMLCDFGYAYILENHIAVLNKHIEQGGIPLLHAYAHPSLMETRDYLQEFWMAWLAKHPEYVVRIQSTAA